MDSNSLRQYIELYKGHAQAFNAGSTDALNAWRPKACELLETMSLPRRGSENYEHTDLNALLAPDFGLNPTRVPMAVNPAESFSCHVPNMSTALYFLLNDGFAASENAARQLPEGVICGSLRHVLHTHPELAGHYNSIADMKNPLVALNTLLAQDGFILYVPDGVKVEKPIQLVNILQSTMPLMAPRRILIVMGERAEAKVLICDHTQNKNLDYLALSTVELVCGAYSRLDYYDLEESSPRTTRLCSLYASMQQGADLLVDGITLNNGNTRNEYYAYMHGEECELRLLGMGIESGDRKLDNYSLISHLKPRCHSNELFKYVVDDEATGAFCGRIYVAPGAVKTEAYQANRNVLGTDKARMFSKPQLEIYNDDVKCSHGTAIGRFDEKQLFYMQARGLSRQMAETLLKQAFMADVIAGVRLEPLRDRLTHLVELRFGCGDATAECASCALN